jgi:5-methylthioadenosine/S-adenosylhomocysteine deaminase
MDAQRRMIPDGAVAVTHGKIVAIGKTESLTRDYTAGRTIEAKNKVVLPGLINTHTHLYQIMMRSLGDDMNLLDWWSKGVAPASLRIKGEHCYYAALTGSLELIKSGCTCTVDNMEPCFPVEGLPDECVRAFVDVGIRGVEAMGAADVEKPWWPVPNEFRKDTEHAIDANLKLIRKWNGAANGRVNVWFGTSCPMACSDEAMQRMHDLSKELNVAICCHLHETRHEVESWKKDTGLTPIQYYDRKIRFLDSNLLAVHCVWMDDEDIRILARRHVTVSHNPVSNMYLASGIAPIPRLLSNGITVGLGVDGAASNNNQDMFELIKTTAILHKAASLDPLAITAEKVLEMATIEGAKSIFMDKEIGSLEVGKKADIILLNIRETNMVPVNNLVSQLVYCGKSSNVETAIIDGRLVMENRIVNTVDEKLTLERTQDLASDLTQRNT